MKLLRFQTTQKNDRKEPYSYNRIFYGRPLKIDGNSGSTTLQGILFQGIPLK